MKRVEKWTFGYQTLRFFAGIIHRLTHKHFTIKGLENVPKNQPVIFAPNHQNALLDPLAIVFAGNFQPVFLGRADIFKKKFIARILNFMKIAPVYRIRDGKESLEKNKAVFENSVRILQNNRYLCLFPEGKHVGMKSMDPHKKAIPRIVFIAAELTNFDLDINIVPVGINYSHYYKFRRNVTINFGEPIKTKAYYDIYKTEGETKASNAMRADIFNAVSKLVVHVPNKNHYELYEQAFEMMRNETAQKLGIERMHKYFFDIERFLTAKIADKLLGNDELGEQLSQKATKYQCLKEKLKLRERALVKGEIGFGKTVFSFFVMVLMLPFGIFGAIANGWVFYVTRYPYRKKIKDRQFWSTFSFGLSFVLYYLWLVILFFILAAVFKNWWLAVVLVLVSVPSGIIAWETGQFFLQVIRRLRFNSLQRKNDKTFAQMMELRAELYDFYQNSIS